MANYYGMSLEELDKACDKQHQVILENRAWLRENRGKHNAEEELQREMAVAEAQAHFNVISRLRTAHNIGREFEASQQVQALRGRISEETYRSMLQDIGVPYIEGDTQVSGGSVENPQSVE